jgi:hypothetical protein
MYTSTSSDEVKADEAKLCARHSDQTQSKYHLRQPDPEFMANVVNIPQNKRRKMHPSSAEEHLRLSCGCNQVVRCLYIDVLSERPKANHIRRA